MTDFLVRFVWARPKNLLSLRHNMKEQFHSFEGHPKIPFYVPSNFIPAAGVSFIYLFVVVVFLWLGIFMFCHCISVDCTDPKKVTVSQADKLNREKFYVSFEIFKSESWVINKTFALRSEKVTHYRLMVGPSPLHPLSLPTPSCVVKAHV